MGITTKIDWCDSTWNPLRGCSHVSAGCDHCYAERMTARFAGPGQPHDGLVENGRWTGNVWGVEEHLLDPLKWGGILEECPQCASIGLDPMNCMPLDNGHRPGNTARPRRIFVDSMSDLFHENVTDEMRDKILVVMILGWRHQYQVLTKRAKAMRDYFIELAENPGDRLEDAACEMDLDEDTGCHVSNFVNGWARWQEMLDDGNPLNGTVRRWPLPNIWLGVSVENQATADERIPLLLQTPAAMRFVSCEPLLGAVVLPWLGLNSSLSKWKDGDVAPDRYKAAWAAQITGGPSIGWVIAGGESGPGARPMHPDWARGLRDQCQAAGVPFFFKSWGEWGRLEDHRGLGWKVGDERTGYFSQDAPGDYEWHSMGVASDGQHMLRVGKKAAGRLLDGRAWEQFPEARG
jgi:protein gp37